MLFLPLAIIAASMAQADPCDGVSQLSMDECSEAAYRRADIILNKYYAAALARLNRDGNSKSKKELIAAQRSWVAYRDAECSAVYDNYNGSIDNERMIECQERLTKIRTYMIWDHWLTYEDSTPPILPSPDVHGVVDDKPTSQRNGT